MKNMFYVAQDLRAAIGFIEVNTDWKKASNVSFRNGDERITVISDFRRMMGRHVDGIYIDHSFSSIRPDIRSDFQHRFDYLGIEPVLLGQKTPYQSNWFQSN